MTTSDPERPSQPFGGTEYPSLENSEAYRSLENSEAYRSLENSAAYPSLENSEAQTDPDPPVDYPTDAGLPPPVYPPPYPGAAGYYPGYPGSPGYYPGGYDPYQPTKPPGTNGKATAALVTSLVGLFCCALPSIVGLVLGVI